MLKLDNIKKEYSVAGTTNPALKGISIEFRKSEFVSILGQSGCGKTTLLNIIGGLDHYSSGDLVISGVSTKDFRDSDWDAYRNHTVGFVFQSYNLISHLNVLSNVELALTISGVPASARKSRAIAALERVGLKDHLNKMPNQLSGGQMQRVAIARAIVNDPEILLADEPTGALDTATSVQIMDLIQEIAKERLVIMVTHNPELAEKYSTRIIKLLDGAIVEDTNPYQSATDTTTAATNKNSPAIETCAADENATAGKDRATAEMDATDAGKDGAADKNATSKKKTKACASHSGATVTDKSTPTLNDGANTQQSDANTTTADTATQDSSKTSKSGKQKKKKAETPFKKTSMSFWTALTLSFKNLLSKKARTILVAIASSVGIIGVSLVLALSNGFNLYINKIQKDMLSTYPLTVSEQGFDYSALSTFMQDSGLDKFPAAEKVIVDDITKKLTNLRPTTKITQDYIDNAINTLDESLYADVIMTTGQLLHVYTFDNATSKYKYIEVNESSDMASSAYAMLGSDSSWQLLIDNKDFILSQYDIIGGTYPQTENELVLFVDKYNQVGDNILKQLGVYTAGATEIDFDDILNKTFYLASNSTYYTFDSVNNRYNAGANNFSESTFDKSKYKEVKIGAIMRPRADTQNQVYATGIAYSQELADFMQQSNLTSEIVEFTNDNPTIDPLTGEPYQLGATFATTEAAFETRLRELGGVALPNYISIYPLNFDSKNLIMAHLDAYNEGKPEDEQIHYNDVMGMVMSSLTSMVDIIGYVLIAFSAISLIVSSIMIAVITYVSVIERTKEIGVLRSLGARKKDIARVFNAETFMIGLLAGIIGVGVTLLLTIPINLIISGLSDTIGSIAILSPVAGISMIAISVGLTLLAGFIPSRMASKKDPVTCLRSE